MEKEIMEQLQLIVEGMAQMEDRIKAEVRNEIRQEVRESETRVKVFIENQVSDKIKGLFDGYKSALECLRHTYCTDLQDKGVPINIAKYLMGHSDIRVTAGIYTHITEEAIESAALLSSSLSTPATRKPLSYHIN